MHDNTKVSENHAIPYQPRLKVLEDYFNIFRASRRESDYEGVSRAPGYRVVRNDRYKLRRIILPGCDMLEWCKRRERVVIAIAPREERRGTQRIIRFGLMPNPADKFIRLPSLLNAEYAPGSFFARMCPCINPFEHESESLNSKFGKFFIFIITVHLPHYATSYSLEFQSSIAPFILFVPMEPFDKRNALPARDAVRNNTTVSTLQLYRYRLLYQNVRVQ